MPASDYFTATSYSDYNETPNYISFRLLGTAGSSITFKDNYNTYFFQVNHVAHHTTY